jgi:3-oxoadipate enol-lactonase
MPFTKSVDGIRVHYHLAGRVDGEPLLMLMGLGADSRGWIMQQRTLGSRYRLVMVDNRGAGRSDKPAGAYDLLTMADDAIACLRAAGFESAHVLGASMGGILAQVMAAHHPERVRSLVLACTACRHHQWRRELLEEWIDTARSDGMRKFARTNMEWLIGGRSLRRVALGMHLFGPLAFNLSGPAFISQVQAILAMDATFASSLSDVVAPTLVTVGSQDRLTPVGDSEEVASRIAGAELEVVRGGAHLFMVEHAVTFNRLVLDFLDRSVPSSTNPAPFALRSAPA